MLQNAALICVPNWKCWLIHFWSWAKVDRIYLGIDLVLSLFPKWYKHTGIYKKQAKPKNRIFVYWMAYSLAYWITDSIVGSTVVSHLCFPCAACSTWCRSLVINPLAWVAWFALWVFLVSRLAWFCRGGGGGCITKMLKPKHWNDMCTANPIGGRLYKALRHGR